MGIGILLKSFLPLSLYLGGLGCALMAITGRVQWALLVVTFLLPLRNIIERVQGFPLGNQFIDILLLGVMIGWVLHHKSKNDKNSQPSSINIIAIVMIGYLFISTLYGGFYLYGGLSFDIHDERVQDWKNICLMPLLFLITSNNLASKKEVWVTVAVICFSMFAVDYYTILQIREHSSLVSRELIRGTFQFLGPNEVAAFLNTYTIILMSLFYAIKKGKYKWLLFLLILINLYCIVFLYSRGAYAGLLVGMLILFAIKDRKLLIPLVLTLLFWQALLPQKAIDRIKETKSESGELDASAQGRLDMWERGLELFYSNPVIGIGYGSFRHMGFSLQDTHNIYVKILTEQGVVGIIVFLITLFCFMKEGFKLYQKGDDDLSKAIGLGFFISIFVMMVNNFFGDRWSYLEPNAYLWIFAGLVARLNVIAQNPQSVKIEASQKVALQETVDPEKTKKRIRYYDPPANA